VVIVATMHKTTSKRPINFIATKNELLMKILKEDLVNDEHSKQTIERTFIVKNLSKFHLNKLKKIRNDN